MRESTRFHFFVEFLSHSRGVATAYARGLSTRHPRDIRGLGKVVNFMVLQFQMLLPRILGRIAVQSQKDSNICNSLLFQSMCDNYLQNRCAHLFRHPCCTCIILNLLTHGLIPCSSQRPNYQRYQWVFKSFRRYQQVLKSFCQRLMALIIMYIATWSLS